MCLQREIGYDIMTNNKQRPANSGLAKGGLTCFVETFVQGSSFVLLMNFYAENLSLRQAENRYVQF